MSRAAARRTGRAGRPRAGRYARLRARRGRRCQPHRPADGGGRWSLAPRREPDPTRRAHARAEAFLERHGVLTRGALDTERVTGGFAGVYKVLRAMEESGRCRRGYVVEGLGAAQFAVPGAVDRLRAHVPAGRSPARSRPSRRAWCWPPPTRPSPTARPCPGRTRSATPSTGPGRKAGALVVLVDGGAGAVRRAGRPVAAVVHRGRDELRAAAEALAGAVHEGWLGLAGGPARRRRSTARLGRWPRCCTDAGFRATPKGLRLRA